MSIYAQQGERARKQWRGPAGAVQYRSLSSLSLKLVLALGLCCSCAMTCGQFNRRTPPPVQVQQVRVQTVPARLCRLGVSTAAALWALTGSTPAPGSGPMPAWAFDNAVKVVQMPKTPGPEPRGLGLNDKGRLSFCGKPSPNCFSTTADTGTPEDEDDPEDTIPDEHVIPRWKYTKNTDIDEAYRLIGQVLQSYEPGQSGIDGGGFKIITSDPIKHYYYVQFESLKRGFRDDLEIAVDMDGSVQVRSSSRLGYLDYGVNGKRLNFIAARLRAVGFSALEISAKTHPIYFEENSRI